MKKENQKVKEQLPTNGVKQKIILIEWQKNRQEIYNARSHDVLKFIDNIIYMMRDKGVTFI